MTYRTLLDREQASGLSPTALETRNFELADMLDTQLGCLGSLKL